MNYFEALSKRSKGNMSWEDRINLLARRVDNRPIKDGRRRRDLDVSPEDAKNDILSTFERVVD